MSTTAEVEALMKRCQIGVGGRHALDTAHDILAECYGTLGALVEERDRLRDALKRCESWMTNENSHTIDGRLIDRREELPIQWRIIDQAREAINASSDCQPW